MECSPRGVSRLALQAVLATLFLFLATGNGFLMIPHGTGMCPPISECHRNVLVEKEIQCAMLCLREFHCHGVCYNPEKLRCLTYNFDLTAANGLLESLPGFNMYWADSLNGYSRFGRIAYYNLNQAGGFDYAVQFCKSRGSSLILPKSSEEEDRIKSALASDAWLYVNLPPNAASPRDYVDLQTGMIIEYKKFSANTANGEACAIIETKPLWKGVPCNELHGIICESGV
ncbi:uncharacterized protein LOC135194856 [Macrobrachium nipponense]|uniref:uncharacterized protein LOC135194856 n=1 Tax=Macrobrachium nipponense TaxID=159736 RepID=UPI0030C7EC06